jgi:hypothetical protein
VGIERVASIRLGADGAADKTVEDENGKWIIENG